MAQKIRESGEMGAMSAVYAQNVHAMDTALHVGQSFDIIRKVMAVADGEVTLYYIDGFVKDAVMQKLLLSFLSVKSLEDSAEAFCRKAVPHVEAEAVSNFSSMVTAVLSGAVIMLGSSFGASALMIDARSYPARQTEEPEGDRVMRGSRDGFVETLIFNTALVRRRVRHPSLTMRHYSIGKESATDVVMCFMSDRADGDYVKSLDQRLRSIKVGALTMGQQSLRECLIRSQWYNPFPKVRITERPDVAAAQVLEGSVLIMVDNTPEVMVLPTSVFDFMQETNDFYFPPLTGTYVRVVRYAVFLTTLLITPLWYLLLRHQDMVPAWLAFVLPEQTGKIPILVQLLLVEFIIDALRLASANTPDMLSNSLSVVGGLILGDFAVDIGWLIPEVILYMAFVAIANFTQRSYELGYAFKFLRMMLLLLTAGLGIWGFVGGCILILILLASNRGLNGKRHYLYPLIPFRPRALASLLVRLPKSREKKSN